MDKYDLTPDEHDRTPITQLRREGDGRDVAYLQTVRVGWASIGETLLAIADKKAERRKREYVRRSIRNG